MADRGVIFARADAAGHLQPTAGSRRSVASLKTQAIPDAAAMARALLSKRTEAGVVKHNPRARRKVAEEILAYFLRNARAADDLEGIVRFRLLDQGIERRLSEASEALAWLVSGGLLNRTVRPGTGPIFSLNEEKRNQAEKFVTGKSMYSARRRKKSVD